MNPIEGKIHFHTAGHGAKRLRPGEAPIPPQTHPGRLPRVTKLMALAIRFEELLADGSVKDYAELARLGNVSRTRITQIMNLRLLAPDIQEKILFYERVHAAKDTIQLRDLQEVAQEVDWKRQRELLVTFFNTTATKA